MNGGAKFRKWGGFGWLGTEGHGQCHHSAGPLSAVRPWPDHFFCHEFFKTSFCLLKSQLNPPPLTTALRHYMAGPLLKSRLRPCSVERVRLPIQL